MEPNEKIGNPGCDDCEDKNAVKLTAALEDYLEMIYFLHKRNEDVRLTDVAVEMNISKPSVNKAVNILKKMDYLTHEHYGLLILTDLGMAEAKKIAGRHYLLKNFLGAVLGVEEALAETEACAVEHSLCAETLSKLSEFLKNHGYDIEFKD